jgi:hypothetical protein
MSINLSWRDEFHEGGLKLSSCWKTLIQAQEMFLFKFFFLTNLMVLEFKITFWVFKMFLGVNKFKIDFLSIRTQNSTR